MTTLAQQFGFTADQLQALTSQAFDLIDAGDLDGAVAVFDGLLALNPEEARLQAALGSVFHQQGKLSEAMAAYDEALALDADAVLARVNRGELRCKRGDTGGVEDLKIAARIPSAVQARAQALVRLYAR
jgi:Flp pilus assembly protein TadD